MATLGGVLYRGPSRLDGKPIVAIATGFKASANRKTGKMIQIWIIREDVAPNKAMAENGDASICGDCPQRWNQGGSCYVVVAQAPLSVYRAYVAGRYEDWTRRLPDNILKGKSVRFGAYGDPAAVPVRVWNRVRRQKLRNWTGYTHQWRRYQARHFLMASVDSEAQALEAQKMGWRTFRVRSEDTPNMPGEIDCPSSLGVSCVKCGLCKGFGIIARNIAIPVHGTMAPRWEKKRLPVVVA